jgi:hypothetical protein
MMDFSDALREMKALKKVKRTHWNFWVAVLIPETSLHKPCLCCLTKDECLQPGWAPTQADLFANDWEIYRG